MSLQKSVSSINLTANKAKFFKKSQSFANFNDSKSIFGPKFQNQSSEKESDGSESESSQTELSQHERGLSLKERRLIIVKELSTNEDITRQKYEKLTNIEYSANEKQAFKKEIDHCRNVANIFRCVAILTPSEEQLNSMSDENFVKTDAMLSELHSLLENLADRGGSIYNLKLTEGAKKNLLLEITQFKIKYGNLSVRVVRIIDFICTTLGAMVGAGAGAVLGAVAGASVGGVVLSIPTATIGIAGGGALGAGLGAAAGKIVTCSIINFFNSYGQVPKAAKQLAKLVNNAKILASDNESLLSRK